VIGAVAVAWLYSGDALPPEARLHMALPLVNFHHHFARAAAGGVRRVRGVRADGGVERRETSPTGWTGWPSGR